MVKYRDEIPVHWFQFTVKGDRITNSAFIIDILWFNIFPNRTNAFPYEGHFGAT